MRTTDRPQNPLIKRAIALAGESKQSILASKLGVVQQTVSKMLLGEIPVQAEIAVKIHHLTGGQVSKAALRPDLFEDTERAA